MKYLTSNIQIPEKFQASNFNGHFLTLNFGASSLEFLWSLEVGAGSF
jgi:hypothetical protein